MSPGRELDTLVAEKIFGHEVIKTVWASGRCSAFTIGEPSYIDTAGEMSLTNLVPSYSTDISAAWGVVEELVQDSWIVTVTQSEFAYSCYLECGPKARGKIEAFGQSPTHSICLAALKVIDSKFGTSQ